MAFSIDYVKKVCAACSHSAKVKPRFYKGNPNNNLVTAILPWHRASIDFKGPVVTKIPMSPIFLQGKESQIVIRRFTTLLEMFTAKELTNPSGEQLSCFFHRANCRNPCGKWFSRMLYTLWDLCFAPTILLTKDFSNFQDDQRMVYLYLTGYWSLVRSCLAILFAKEWPILPRSELIDAHTKYTLLRHSDGK